MIRPTKLGCTILLTIWVILGLVFVYHVIAWYWLIPLAASLGLMALDYHRRNPPP